MNRKHCSVLCYVRSRSGSGEAGVLVSGNIPNDLTRYALFASDSELLVNGYTQLQSVVASVLYENA